MNKLEGKHWNELGFGEKLKFTIAGGLVFASVVLGFISFILLLEVPTSVIGLDGLWLSTALAVLGIGSYFHNELVKFQAEVSSRLDRIGDKKIDEKTE